MVMHDHSVDLPSRGPRLTDLPMLVSFDIDRGELVPGHHFVARGLATCEVPHQDDLEAAWAEANPRLSAESSEIQSSPFANHFVSFTVPPGGFTDADMSEEAMVWRRHRGLRDAIARARHVPGFIFHYDLVPGLTEAEAEAGGGSIPWIVEVDYTADRDLPWPVSDGGAMEPAEGRPATHGVCEPWPIPNGARVLTFTLRGIDVETGYSRENPDGQLTVDLSTHSARWVPTS